MHGDFSLNPLSYRARVSRVLFQQGRVQLDSDSNEQTESLLRSVRGLAFDTIGAHGGIGDAFEVVPAADLAESLIGWGVYYVDGIRCVNFPVDFDILEVAGGATIADALPFNGQPDYVLPEDEDLGKDPLLFYLDVFERHLSAAQDDSLREVALLGPDTASRAVVVWQVRAMPSELFDEVLKGVVVPAGWEKTWDKPYLALNLVLRSRARLRARAVIKEATDPCTIAPDARYRGTENRLFRVEIHNPGEPKSKPQPSFKWSADNGAIVYPIREIQGAVVHLDSLGRDDRTMIQINDWVEVVGDRALRKGAAYPLLQVVDVRPNDMTVTLSAEPEDHAGADGNLRPILRRWAGAPVTIREGKSERDGWFELADGVEVQFSLPPSGSGAGYRTGDYWLIPARTATGDVQWPRDSDSGVPRAISPHGVAHHYAPLARIEPDGSVASFRRTFAPSAKAKP